ncbi:MAG: ImmA/IrrE family metallo-endopeptidase [SAR202 cluster bacterium]|nr:ImmA/IrrE family metallo-endopeptidase [SAR202 cluster bacterium]
MVSRASSASPSTASAGRRVGVSYGVGGLPLWNQQQAPSWPSAPKPLPKPLKVAEPASLARPADSLSLYAGRTALGLWQSHGLTTPVDLKALAATLGLKVVQFPFVGRIAEAVVQGVLALPPDLDKKWFRWRVAHAIGHYMMHVGTSYYVESEQWPGHEGAERQAEEFAAWLLAGPKGQGLSPEEALLPKEKWRFTLDYLGGVSEVVRAG